MFLLIEQNWILVLHGDVFDLEGTEDATEHHWIPPGTVVGGTLEKSTTVGG